ncbi:MAG: hypothetical protein R2991_10910 [Thermoanaerobaculia bacterium]
MNGQRLLSSAGVALRSILRPAHALRALSVPALVVLIGVGCLLDRSGLAPAESTFHCVATVRSPDGAMDRADSSLEPWTGTPCSNATAAATDEWNRLLFEVATTDPAVAALGFSCVEDVVCETPTPLPAGMTCPAPRTGSMLPPCPASPARCLEIVPPTTDAGFDARVDFPSGTIGVASPPESATISNVCTEPVRLFVAEILAGRDATWFARVSSTCGPRDDEERAIGRLLGAGETCTLEFVFQPLAMMGFASASQDVSQDTVEAYRIRLFGTGISP